MNKAFLMGRLTKDPALTTTSNNISVCNFTVAVDRNYKNSRGERETDFIPVVCWRGTAEFVDRYFRKGDPIIVIGRIEVNSWKDEQNEWHNITRVQADEIEFVLSNRRQQSTAGENSAKQSGDWLSASSDLPNDFAKQSSSSQNTRKEAPETAPDIPVGDGLLVDPVDTDEDYLPFDL